MKRSVKQAKAAPCTKYRVDLVTFNLEQEAWEYTPGWEFDGRTVRPLCRFAGQYRQVTWKKAYTPEDGMDFMRALHYGLQGSFIGATHPYPVKEGKGDDLEKAPERKLVKKERGVVWTYSVEGEGANRTICLWGCKNDDLPDDYWMMDNVQMEDFSYAHVNRIGAGAFSGFRALKSLNVPSSVKKIGARAFEDCGELKTVKLPVRLEDIGDYAFCRCTRLEELVIPDTVARIGDGAFAHCDGLAEVTLGKGLKEIGSGTFEGCGALEAIAIPDTVTRIGSVAFGDCSSLKTIRLGEGVRSIAPDAFRGCGKLGEIVFPASAERLVDAALPEFKGERKWLVKTAGREWTYTVEFGENGPEATV